MKAGRGGCSASPSRTATPDAHSPPVSRIRLGASLFSRLLDSGEAEIAFVAYVFWFDWLMAEKEGLCSREETDEALRSLVDSFNVDSPSDALSLWLNSLQKLKNRVENSEGSFGFTWPEALLDPDRPFPHKSCFPKREMMSDAPSS